MREAVTAIVVQVEITTYSDDGKVSKRREQRIVECESDIPEAVMEYLKKKTQVG